MKIAIITDQHYGVRADSAHFLDYYEKFYTNFFFPYLRENNIQTIFDLGDTFDRRKYINFNTLKRAKEMYFDVIENENFFLHTLIGNHTVYFKNTNEVNTMDLIFDDYKNIRIYPDLPEEIEIDGLKILMTPWICSGNYERSMEIIQNTSAQILMGHLEIAGFQMYKGSVCSHGFDKEVFRRFDTVYSGHFHHKSSDGNINYLGAPYEMTWSDYNDERGFHIFDTETREIEFIENPYKIHAKIIYNDANANMEEIVGQDYSKYKDMYVKVIVKEKTNPYWFDLMMNKLEEAGPHSVQTVEDHLNLDLDNDDIINEAEDTMTILSNYIDSMEVSANKEKIRNIIKELYLESISV